MRQERIWTVVIIGALLLTLGGCAAPDAGTEGEAPTVTVDVASSAAPTSTVVPATATAEPAEQPADELDDVSDAETDEEDVSEGQEIFEQDDAGSGGDASDTVGRALAIELDTEYDGALLEDDSDDWYMVAVPGGAVLTVAVSVDPDAEYVSAILMNEDQTEIGSAWNITPGRSEAVTAVLGAADEGDYYLLMSGVGAYTFSIEAVSQDDAQSGADAGGVFDEAVLLAEEGEFAGLLGGSDEQDWYALDLADGSVLELTFLPDRASEELSVTLLDAEREALWSEWYVPGGATRTVRYRLGDMSGGTYYVDVEGGHGAYALTVAMLDQDDAASGQDAPSDIEDAIEIATDTPLEGEVGELDTADSYRFSGAEGLVITVTAERGTKDLLVSVFDSEENEVWYDYPASGKSVTYTLEDILEGDYVLRIADGHGAYSFEITE